MKKIFLTFILLLSAFTFSMSQEIAQKFIAGFWDARWIIPTQGSALDYGVYHFRKSISLEEKPQHFWVHVSADNRYNFYVNGQKVGMGPSRGDLNHWRFDTYDLAPFLKAGENQLAAEVWNFGILMPQSQITWRTAFLVQGNSNLESIANTGDGKWKVFQNPAYSPTGPFNKELNTYIVVGPGDNVDGNNYPWGWKNSDFDDSQWATPQPFDIARPRGTGTDGTWYLVPSELPHQEERLQRMAKVRKSDISVNDAFLQGKAPLNVPANTTATLLIDQGHLTNAFPELVVSGGKGATIKMSYAEALFTEDRQKGNRNEIEGKKFLGSFDLFHPDGGINRSFVPLWFRCFRYIELEIVTQEEPLVVADLSSKFTGYPFEENAVFKTDDKGLIPIWEVGWRTARLCAGEIYYDCPYYEQMQYVGDTRIQALISLYVSGDDRLMRKAIKVYDESRTPEGLTQSRYPSSSFQVIPPYSLFWVSMIYDYWMHRDDTAFVASFLEGTQGVLAWHERQRDNTGMLADIPWWNFVDWTDQWPWDPEARVGGVPLKGNKGKSSILNLQYAYVLEMAAALHKAFGMEDLAKKYSAQAATTREATYKQCWDETKGMLADTPEKMAYSQHANALAVLTGVVSQEDAKAFLQKVISDESLIQCTFYYRFYLEEAMQKAGLNEDYLTTLKPWHTMIENGLTTFAEKPDPTRSDCHAWSAAPLYRFLSMVCGVNPGSPGFKTVRISPALGHLTDIDAKIPHPDGEIEIALKKNKKGLTAQVRLPKGITGVFAWNGKEVMLKEGFQELTL